MIDAVVVAVGALGEDVESALAIFCAVLRIGSNGVSFDDVVDVGKLASGMEIVIFERFENVEIFDGAIGHEEEHVFVAGGLRGEHAVEGVNWCAREAKVGDVFLAGLGKVIITEVVLDSVVVDVKVWSGSGVIEADSEGVKTVTKAEALIMIRGNKVVFGRVGFEI